MADGVERQARALELWEKQKKIWDKMQRSVAAKVHKSDPVNTLQGSTHHQRMRNEELSILDVSVPATVRNGSNAWEMSLRGGAGGVRFVQIGKAYPYPLYCPIKDSDVVGSDSNALMRMIPSDPVPSRHKPVSETEYFHERQMEFQKYVKKKFAHFVPNQEPMVLEGTKAPTTKQPIAEDESVEPVLFIATQPQGNNAHPTTQYMTEEPKSRPLSAVTTATSHPGGHSITAPPVGPMLCFSASHLGFNTAPGEAAQGVINVDNIGTTAVYYSWAVVPQTPLEGSDKQPDYFRLSDPSSGVMLPEDQRAFTFTIRAANPGIYTKQYELLTVPAGKERIIVTLRGVVLSNEVNDVATARLERELSRKAIRDYQRQMLTEPIGNPHNHTLDHANIEIELRNLAKAKAQQLAALKGVGEFQEVSWTEQNSFLQIPYNQAVYGKILALHRNFQAFLGLVEQSVAGSSSSPAATASSSSSRSPIAAKEWDGSVKSLIEDLTALKDAQARNTFLSALNALLRCAKVSLDKGESLHTLQVRSSGRNAFFNVAEEIHRYSSIARDLAEGKSSKAKVEKVDPKAGAKPPPKPAKGAKPGAPPPAGSPELKSSDAASSDLAKHPNYDKFLFAGARRIVGDAVEAIFASVELMDDLVSCVTDRPFECSVRKRMESIVTAQGTADAEIDTTPEAAKPKKK